MALAPSAPVSETALSWRRARWIDPFARAGVEGTVAGAGGKRIVFRYHRQPDREGEAGAVVVMTGRAEALVKYEEVAWDLYRRRYSVYRFDHRGQGFSDRVAADPWVGHVESFDRYVEDLATVLDRVVSPGGHRHTFLLAHSMGGCVASLYLASSGVAPLTGAALSSPMHAPGRLPVLLRRWACAAVSAASRFAPERYLPGTGPCDGSAMPFAGNPLTHSRARFSAMEEGFRRHPSIRLGGPSLRWTAEACRAGERAVEEGGRIRTPVLLLQAGADRVVCPRAQERFAAAMGAASPAPCIPVRLPGGRHELLMEAPPWREAALSAILAFFEACRKGKAKKT
jgi:lysophospholipase